ncbi:MAG: monofunctional biosynthetic peptidoglycan transglycosylase [Geminicoccaceae bacterium]
MPASARPARLRFLPGWLNRRRVLRVLLFLALSPTALILVYRFVPPPVTLLMLVRLAEGESLEKSWRPLEEISPRLAQAVIASEDNRFCEHFGFDWREIGGQIDRALAGRSTRGASTITQQTTKNVLLWPGRDPVRKLLEAALTPQLELLWGKRRIMEVYLNVAETGPGLYGAEAAARHYFGRPAKDLTRRQAALIAAILPNPRVWSPAKPTSYIRRRADVIERRIRQLGPLLDCVG